MRVRAERLEYFLAVADTGHVGRAAQQLHISQPALSQQLRKLEAHLHTRLLDRTPRGVRLTPAGRLLAQRARRVLRQLDRLEDDVTAFGEGRRGTVTIAYTRSGSSAGTRGLIDAFRRAYPDVDVTTTSGWTAWNLAQLADGAVDAAFVRAPVHDDRFRLTPVDDQELVAVLAGPATTGRRISAAALRSSPFVFWPRTQAPDAYDDVLEQVWGDRPPVEQVSEPDGEQLVAAVEAGRGFTLMGDARAAQFAGRDVHVRRLAGARRSSVLALAVRAGSDDPAVLRLEAQLRPNSG